MALCSLPMVQMDNQLSQKKRRWSNCWTGRTNRRYIVPTAVALFMCEVDPANACNCTLPINVGNAPGVPKENRSDICAANWCWLNGCERNFPEPPFLWKK